MDRQAFLANIRSAARQGQAYRVHTRTVPPRTGYVGASGDLCEHLAAESEAVGGYAKIVTDHAAARALLVELLNQYQVRSALCWQHAVLERVGVCELLREREITFLDADALAIHSRAEQRASVLAAEIGITSVDLAIAETGTLLVMSQAAQPRMASLVPPVHVAIVEEEQIVPDLFDAFAMLHARGVQNLPSNLAFITGPSKTGDIEQKLTTGVHGPKHWHVVVIRKAASIATRDFAGQPQ